MVKDSKNSHPGNPLWGDGWGWSWFDRGQATENNLNRLQGRAVRVAMYRQSRLIGFTLTDISPATLNFVCVSSTLMSGMTKLFISPFEAC